MYRRPLTLDVEPLDEIVHILEGVATNNAQALLGQIDFDSVAKATVRQVDHALLLCRVVPR